MNRWKVAFFVAVLIALLSNGYWLVRSIDGAISYSYLIDSYNQERSRFNALGALVVAGSDDYDKADILHLLRQAQADAFIVEEPDKIAYESIEFVFSDGQLVEVK